MEPSLEALGRVSEAGGWIVDTFSLNINVTWILEQSEQGMHRHMSLLFYAKFKTSCADSAIFWYM